MNIVLFGHGGYTNRGCEAIVRATVKMIKAQMPDAKIRLCSYDPKYDIEKNYGIVEHIYPHHNVRYTLPHLMAYGFRRLGLKKLDIKLQYNWLKAPLKWGDVFMSIGGDNYCYEEPVDFFQIDKLIKGNGKKLIMWGASFDGAMITDNMKEDLSLFNAIFVRETLSFDALKKHGIENVILHPDSAFTMDVKDIEDSGKYIGFNLSPLSLRYSKDSTDAYNAVYKMMDYIIQETDYKVKLISHVIDPTHADTQYDPGVLLPLYDKYKNTGRVIYIDSEPLDATQIKGHIKSCTAFIGARTHSTIAAYSTLVPTTVIGYSIKSRGIAKDLFGTNDEYVIPVSEVKGEVLVEAVKRLIEENSKLRTHMEDIMPEYKKRAESAAKAFKEVLR